MGPLWCILEPPWVHLETFYGHLGVSWARLGHPGTTLGHLVATLHQLGTTLSYPGSSWEQSQSIPGCSGAPGGVPGVLLGHLSRVLGCCRVVLFSSARWFRPEAPSAGRLTRDVDDLSFNFLDASLKKLTVSTLRFRFVKSVLTFNS